MTIAPIVERFTGDVVPASDHNDIKDYIEDGAYRINTLSLSVGNFEVVDSGGYWVGHPVSADVSLIDIQTQFDTTVGESYMEISSFTPDGDPTLVQVWDDSLKTTLLYSRSITYTDGLPTEIAVSDLVREKIFRTIISYDINGEVESVEKRIENFV